MEKKQFFFHHVYILHNASHTPLLNLTLFDHIWVEEIISFVSDPPTLLLV
jgi:hypothetical protein